MITAVIQPDVDAYLREHLQDDVAAFALKKHPFTDIPTIALAQQLAGLKKARLKLPHFFYNHKIIYPPIKNMEQTSSEIAATYKAGLTTGSSIIDLTGGMGVDVYAFAKAYKSVSHIELNEQLQVIAAHNFKALGIAAKSYCNNGIEFLQNHNTTYDLIYLDPSRKTAASTKAIALKDYEPNVVDEIDLFFKHSDTVMIKTSPMLDLTAGLRDLKYVEQLHIVAIKNEVKELLWILKKQPEPLEVICNNLETNREPFRYYWNDKKHINYSTVQSFLYEPHADVMKSQAYDQLCSQYNVFKLDTNTQLFTSADKKIFPGRIFKVKQVLNYKAKEIKKQYGNLAYGIVSRNFKHSVAQLRKQFKFKEHDSTYLFFTTVAGKQVVIEVEKISEYDESLRLKGSLFIF